MATKKILILNGAAADIRSACRTEYNTDSMV